ncbi:unnamed protein product [Adineta steineri]|uniref:non-specific serine/threonine protein kinase n=1 Tax=Adineta steineri TaxID=433720 RepID=A0A818KSV4_9BILA|nr:unnamed protein product [Adineta steineri]
MSTTTSSIRNLKLRYPTSNNRNNMTANGHETKSSRIYSKKPLSATNTSQDYSLNNSYNNHLKKRTVLSNRPIKSISLGEEKTDNHHQNGHISNKQSTNNKPRSASPPIVYHAIAPISSSEETNHQQKSHNEHMSESSRRIANVLAHSRIKTMSNAISSCSDEEGESSLHHSPNQSSRSSSSSIDTDADESDHKLSNNNINNKQTIKPRRFQKTRKTSFSSNNNNHTPPISRTNIRKDDQNQQRSSSNDEDNTELNSINEEISFNNNNNRRLKLFSLKKRDHMATTATTTTDDDTTKHHRYHPLDNLEMNGKKFPSESTGSSPVPTNLTPINPIQTRKATRFQIKSIRKSQQHQILLANAAAAKSSNDDDGSLSNQQPKLSFKPSLLERKHTNTPTTDGENSTTNTDNIVNGAVTALKTAQNNSGNSSGNGYHRVRFHVTQHRKHESPAEEEKVTVPITPSPAPPAPHSSAASAQGEDEEEEEAVAKSPDNRFIKYAKEIGRGAFKTVYRGLDTETSVAVAWCELQDFAQFDRQERARFKEEAEMLKKLQHQNIVRFYDFWEETNPRTNKKVIILVTELMTSGSLKGYIRNFKGQKEEKRINVMKKWCRQILKGLAYLHGRNPPVIHRDLKCDNVFISSTTGCVKIGDLGLATFKTQTFAKSMRGTMEFMAPEMFDEKYDELVDIYSFGLCMLEMITGEYPYIECKGPTAVIKRITNGLKPDCYFKVESEDVREVIDCCIRTKKEERLSVQDLLQHSFFLDDNGLRIDLVRDSSNDSFVTIKNETIDLKLKIVDKAKRKALYPENKVSSTVFEAILFPYNVNNDTPAQIADELIGKNYIFEDDKKFVIQSIKDRVRALNYEIIDRQAGVLPANGKPTVNSTPQPSIIIQQQQQQQQQQQATPVISVPQQTNFVPTPSIIQQTPVEQPAIKPASELPPVKPTVATEPTPITQLPELSPNIPGSAVSLEELEAALKKTFTKNCAQGTTSALVNDTSESTTPLVTQDDSLIPKTVTNTPIIEQQPQQQTEETALPTATEPSTNIPQSSASTIMQTQSQPTTMLTSQQQQMIQNSHLLSQPAQSYSYPTISSPQNIQNNTIPNEIIKQTIHPSSTPTTSTTTTATTTVTAPETTENNHMSISPSATPLSLPQTGESAPPLLPSDTQPPVSGSLQQLEVLLMNTFKKQNKTAGTAHSSDGEAANTTTPSVSSVPVINNDEKNETETIPTESTSLLVDEKKRNITDTLNNSNQSPQQTQNISQQLNESTTFDPLISDDNGNLQELETLFKSTCQKIPASDDTITISPQISSTNDDISDLKSMIMNMSKTLLNKMNIIETKIDEQCSQTRKINHVVTNTILPSLLDLTDIIQETSVSSNLNSHMKSKLENIQTRIRTTQQQQQYHPQQQQNEMKDLMDI